jgi:hypothetical protein
MIARALDAGGPASWVADDEVYGADPGCAPTWKPVAPGTCGPSPAATGSVWHTWANTTAKARFRASTGYGTNMLRLNRALLVFQQPLT